MSGIFVSYRRDDSSGYATLIYDSLAARFGREQVFMDVDTLQPGVDYGVSIDSHVGECDVMVALIGRRWLGAQDAAGRRRLDDPEDWVRSEVAAALARQVRVIPVLVDGATMPQAEELPEPMASLSRREALPLTSGHVRHDLRRLSDAIGDELHAHGRGGWRSRWWLVRSRWGAGRIAAVAAGVAAVVVAGALLLGRGSDTSSAALRSFSAGVDSILEQSRPYRGQVNVVFTRVSGGARPRESEVARLNDVIVNRRGLASAARKLDAPGPLGRNVRSGLIASFDASLAADREIERCIGLSGAARRKQCLGAAGGLSVTATNAKNAFIATYNRLRDQLGRDSVGADF